MGWFFLFCSSSPSPSPFFPSHQADRPALVEDHVLQGHYVRVGQLPQDLDLPQGGDGDALRRKK
jgi:hypothetical protein